MRKFGLLVLWSIILAAAGCAPTITGPIVEEAPPTIAGNNQQGGVNTGTPTQTITKQEKIEPGWVLHLFAPAKEDRKEMCAIGYKDGLKGEHSYTPPSADFKLKNGGWLSFTPSLTETYYYCYNLAQDGEEMPADPPLKPAFIQIFDPKFIRGYSHVMSSFSATIDLKSYDRNDTKGYRAMGFLFTVKEKTWRVLFPLPRSKGTLYIPGPEAENFLNFFPGVYAYADYVKGKTYLYIGMNYKRMSSNLKRLITMADSFSFLISRGYGVELFTISKDRFPDL